MTDDKVSCFSDTTRKVFCAYTNIRNKFVLTITTTDNAVTIIYLLYIIYSTDICLSVYYVLIYNYLSGFTTLVSEYPWIVT